MKKEKKVKKVKKVVKAKTVKPDEVLIPSADTRRF